MSWKETLCRSWLLAPALHWGWFFLIRRACYIGHLPVLLCRSDIAFKLELQASNRVGFQLPPTVFKNFKSESPQTDLCVSSERGGAETRFAFNVPSKISATTSGTNDMH
jgi:hypothetical protein